MLNETEIPRLAGTDLAHAKIWFAAIGDLGLLWHPDDRADDVEFERPVNTKARAVLEEEMSRLRIASGSWSDPGLIYDLASVGRFRAEDVWPGCSIDVQVPNALRTGYVIMEEEDAPTFVVEDMGVFVAVRYEPADVPISSAERVTIRRVLGAGFGPDGGIVLSGGGFEPSTMAVLSRGFTREGLEAAVEAFCEDWSERPASPRRPSPNP